MFSHQLSTNERQDVVHWTGHQRDFGKETLEEKLWTLERHLLSANGQMQQRSPIGGEPRKSS